MKNRILLLSACLAATASAQDAMIALKPLLATRVTASAATDMDFKNGAGELDTYQFSFQSLLSKPIDLPGDFQLFPMIKYQATLLRYDRTPLGFPVNDEDLHTISVPLYAVHMSKQSPWIYGAFVTPSISTDFAHFDTDDIFVDFGAGAAYRFSDQLILGAGVGVFNATGDTSILPGLGVLWRPSDCFGVEIFGPSFSATYYANEKWRFSLDVRSAGGTWNIDSNDASRTLTLRSYRAGLSAQYQFAEGWWAEAGGGITFANRVDLTTHGGLGLYEADLKRMDEGPYGYLSVRKELW